MTQDPKKQDVGASVPVVAIVASIVALVLILGGIYLYRALSTDERFGHLVLATGPKSGTYHGLGIALARER